MGRSQIASGGLQLLGAGHRQHGGPDAVRHPRAEGAVAAPAARGGDPLGFAMTEPEVASSDATNIQLPDRARRRRLRHQRTQVVDFGRDARPLQDLDRDGQDRPRRRRYIGSSRWSSSEDTPGVKVVRDLPVFGYDDPGGPRRGRCSRTSACRASNLIGERGRRLRDRPGAARPGPDPPLHALARRRRAGARADVPSAPRRASRFGRPLAEQGQDPGLDRRVADRDRHGAAADAERGLADGHGRQQGGAHRDLRDQVRGAERGAAR